MLRKAQVDGELQSHMEFLQGNYYAALQLPTPQEAHSSSSGGPTITDRVVKDNYRRLALRFHPGDQKINEQHEQLCCPSLVSSVLVPCRRRISPSNSA